MTFTQELVVGQDVSMVSGIYGCKGKVIKVTPEGVEVMATAQSHLTMIGDLLQFDNKGRSYVTKLPSSYDSTAHPLSPWGWDGNGTYECGPWELEDIQLVREWLQRQPFSLRFLTLLLFMEEAVREQFGEEILKSFEHELRKACRKLPLPEREVN